MREGKAAKEDLGGQEAKQKWFGDNSGNKREILGSGEAPGGHLGSGRENLGEPNKNFSFRGERERFSGFWGSDFVGYFGADFVGYSWGSGWVLWSFGFFSPPRCHHIPRWWGFVTRWGLG